MNVAAEAIADSAQCELVAPSPVAAHPCQIPIEQAPGEKRLEIRCMVAHVVHCTGPDELVMSLAPKKLVRA